MNTIIKQSEHAVEIYGATYRVEVGSLIQPAEWGLASRLEASDWDRADFRLPSQSYPGVSVAVNVRITGRTLQRRPYSDHRWIKVEIEAVGDGEPSEFFPGWAAPVRS